MFKSKVAVAQNQNEYPYKHGGDVYRAQRYLGCELSSIVDFSANINPLVTVSWIQEKLSPYWERVLHYPDPENRELLEAIGAHHGVSVDHIVLGNGATPLIHQVVQVIKPDVARISAPTFGEYEVALARLGIPVSYATCDPNTLQVELDDLADIVLQENQRGLIFLCNPNNPTGQRFEIHAILEMLASLPSGCYLVVDEAFIDFTSLGEANSMSKHLVQWKNLLILRSATKFYGMPGLRLGYMLIGDVELAASMRDQMPIWQVNVFAAGLFLAAYDDVVFHTQTIEAIQKERNELQKALLSLGFRVWPSEVNYFMMAPPNGEALEDVLLKRGILVRCCDNYRGIPKGLYRIAVKKPADRHLLLQTFKEICTFQLKGIEKPAEI